MFRWWCRVPDGRLGRQDFQRRMRPVERSIRDTLWCGARTLEAETGGTWSADGSAFVSRILTVVTTLRHRGRHALDHVTAACTAALHDQRPASLLPAHASSRA